MKLGRNLIESVDKVDAENLEIIRSKVQDLLDNEYLHVEQQTALKKRVVSEVETVKAERKGDINDPIYNRFLEAGKRAVKIVAREG